LTLSTRLWLLGAALPVGALMVVLVIADQLFHLALTSSLDRALLAQAAVESVSLFDGPEDRPHLHMASSPLLETVQLFAPQGTVFGPDGAAVVSYPLRELPSERVYPGVPGEPPQLSTVDVGGAKERRLWVTVGSDSGRPYGLRLSASMALIEASTSTFHWVGFLSTLAAATLLVLAQLSQGSQLRARLSGLRRHLEAVRKGDLEQTLAPESERDELSELREVLARATTALKQAKETQERLLADAAHELRTPLTLMRTSLDLALRRGRTPGELRSALRETHEEVVRLTALANRLLDTVALGKGELVPAPTDLRDLAAIATDAVRPDAQERGLRISLDAPGPATIQGHADSLRQALDNLLSNALKFAPKGTEVLVRVAREGSSWVLSVRDEGPGIPPAERAAVFEPFHRVPGSKPGAGLGLTIVHEVARLHGGRALISDIPRGAEVRIELPAGDPPPPVDQKKK